MERMIENRPGITRLGERFAMSSTPARPPLDVYMLGLVDFEEVQSLQRRLVYDLGERGGGALILCEHPPTISVGRTGSRIHIVPDDEELQGLGIAVHWINRGGGCILHLPGQVSAYFALPLEPLHLLEVHQAEHVDFQRRTGGGRRHRESFPQPRDSRPVLNHPLH